MSRFGKTVASSSSASADVSAAATSFPKLYPGGENDRDCDRGANSIITQDKSCETSFSNDSSNKFYSACTVLKKAMPGLGPAAVGASTGTGTGTGTGTTKRKVEFSDQCVEYHENGNNGASESESSQLLHGTSDYHCDTTATTTRRLSNSKCGSISCVVKGNAQVEINVKTKSSSSHVHPQNELGTTGTTGGTDDEEYGYGTANPVILNPRSLDHTQQPNSTHSRCSSTPVIAQVNLQLHNSGTTTSKNDAVVNVNSCTTKSKTTSSTFGTFRRPTLALGRQNIPNNADDPADNQKPGTPKDQATCQPQQQTQMQTQTQQQQQQQRQERQRQWEAELDLIIPVNEPESSGFTSGGDTSTLTTASPQTEDQQQQQQQLLSAATFGGGLDARVHAHDATVTSSSRNVNPTFVVATEARSILLPPRNTNVNVMNTEDVKNKSFVHNSRIILVPDTITAYLPHDSHDSQTGFGACAGAQHFHHFSPSSTTDTLSTISTDKSGSIDAGIGGGGGERRKGFCPGFNLDVRQICVVCGFLIVAGALGIGVGVPIALQLRQTYSKKESGGLGGGSSGNGSGNGSGWKHETVRKLLSEVPLIDGHNDLAWNLRKFLQNQLLEIKFDKDLRQYEPFAGSAWSHTDLKRLREGRVGAQLWSTYVPCSAQHLDAVQVGMEQIDVIKRLVEKYQNAMMLVRSVKDIETAHLENRIASLIAVEGGHALGNSLAVLRILHDLGARSLTLTHNCNTPWADSASSDQYLPDRGGLTEFGKLVVLECNRLGLIVDLAHVSVQTMSDALTVSRAPVIFSHSAASSLCNHSRNVPDDIMKLVTTNGGLVMVSFYNVFIACNETATMDDVIAHIEHIRQVAGVDHVGIGAGYDGINFVPSGLEDVSKYPDLIEALYNRDGWTELDLKKLIGLNFLRVFKQVEIVRDEWNNAGVGPIEEWIPRNELAGHPTTMCSSRGAS